MKKIVIVAGGDSSEYVVSLKSARGLYSFIDHQKYQVWVAVLHGKDWYVLPDGPDSERHIAIDRNDFSFTDGGQKTLFDFAWITIHGTPGENGMLQGYFDLIGLPYSCCDTLSAALTFNKYVCNHYLNRFDIKTARSVLLRPGDPVNCERILNKCGLPCFVKSNVGGSSFGTTKVKEASQLEAAIELAFREGPEVIIESFLQGTEVTNGYYKTAQREVRLPVTEVVSANEFFDYDAKYNGQVQEITPARIDDKVRDRIQDMTAMAYSLIGCKGIIRADYIICADDIYLLEINTTPGMTATSFIPQQVAAAQMTMGEVMDEIICDTLGL